jgi:3-mercaptopyruvate sulfurtransferase SseA
MQQGGVSDVAALQGGLQAWINAGYPLATGMPQRRE